MASGFSLVLTVCLAAVGTVPVLAQGQGGSAPADKTGDGIFDDDPSVKPSLPSSDASSAPDSKLPPVAGSQNLPQAARGAQEAAAAVERQVEAVPDPAAITAKLAIRDALDRKDAPTAERLFQTALKRFPNDPEFREVQTGRDLRLHEEKARAIFGRTLADGTRLFGRQWEPGRTMEDGESEVTLGVTRRGARAGSAAVNAALTQGYASIIRGDPTRAEKVLTGAIRSHEDHAELYYARVLARGLGGDLKKADEDSLRAVKLSREKPIALSQRACLMMAMGRREEAFAWANRALEGDPKDADALAVRGKFLWTDRDRPDLALADFKKAAEIDPQAYQDAYQRRVRHFHSARAISGVIKRDFKQALADADAALAIDPTDALAHQARGLVFEKTGRIEESIKENTLALKSDPRAMWALAHRGIAMEMLGARSQALADFKRAADIDPALFRKNYERLKRAQREGAPPLWVRKGNDGVLADSR